MHGLALHLSARVAKLTNLDETKDYVLGLISGPQRDNLGIAAGLLLVYTPIWVSYQEES